MGLGFTKDMWSLNISNLSGGQKTRLALGKIILKQPKVLILDEPTNHLDADSVKWLEEEIKAFKGTLLVISHDRCFLDAVTVRDFPLRDKRVNFKVRRRKWYDHTTDEYFTNTYDTVYKGTRYSKEFAAFLKALPGDISPIGPFA